MTADLVAIYVIGSAVMAFVLQVAALAYSTWTGTLHDRDGNVRLALLAIRRTAIVYLVIQLYTVVVFVYRFIYEPAKPTELSLLAVLLTMSVFFLIFTVLVYPAGILVYRSRELYEMDLRERGEYKRPNGQSLHEWFHGEK